jgi:hypothetical protein
VVGKAGFEHYLIGRLAVVFVKLSESGAAGRGVFFEPKPGERSRRKEKGNRFN